MKKKILILGIGGHSRSCIDVIENTNKFKIEGYVAKNKDTKSNDSNLNLLGYDKDLPNLFKSIKYLSFQLGSKEDWYNIIKFKLWNIFS